MDEKTNKKETIGNSLDECISKVLLEICARPLFINLQHANRDTSSVFSDLCGVKGEVEIVGSSTDGLKTARCFDVGDIDMLIYADVTLNADDEATFEYRSENPSWFHIPLPKSLSHLKPVNEKYLSAMLVRSQDKSMFSDGVDHFYKDAPYTVLASSVERSDYKCATTSAVQWSDPVVHEHDKPPANFIPQALCFVWQTENVLLTFLLNKSVGESLQFVRELLYGDELEEETMHDLESKLKVLIAVIKEDIQRVTINILDLVYFRNEPFESLLHNAVDDDVQRASTVKPHGEYSSDLVPVIRCRAWPKPAVGFITRTRVWPDEKVINEIVKEGFRVVPKAAIIEPHPEKDFILSFSHTEVKLIRLLPQEARTAYCLLKMCYKTSEMPLTQGNKMKTYHLKQALLWVSEGRTSDNWVKASLLQRLRWICEFLLKVLKQRYFPSFFVEGSNHIYHFTDNDCDAHIKLFSEIHHNPANFVKIVVDQEWEYNKATLSEDSFHTIQEPGYFSSFTSSELLKFYLNSVASTDGYHIEELCDQKDKAAQEKLFHQLTKDPLNTSPIDNMPFVNDITESQLKHVDIFVQAVSQSNMDLFNVLDYPINDAIKTHELHWLPEEFMEKYPQIRQDSAEVFGEHVLAMLKLRLKYYGNIFHVICNQLYFASFMFPLKPVKNQDAVYIIRFLKELIAKKKYDAENIQDLLHYMFFFCHFTRLRHHKLILTDQILRSMREFLQDARILMTVYFNPRLLMPRPVDTGDRIQTVFGECFTSQG